MIKTHKLSYVFAALSSAYFVREGEPAPKTFTQEEVNALIAAEVTGLKTKNSELIGDVKKFKETLSQFDGLDVTGLKALQQKMDADEDLKLIAEGRVMDVVNKHTARMHEQHARELAAVQDQVKAADQRTNKYQQAVLDNEIRQAATGLHKGAVEDALLHARNVFKLDDNGKAVQMDEQGHVILGKDGKNPFSPAEWFERMKEDKPHWFPVQTSGSGSGEARQGQPAGKTMKRSDFDALPPAQRGPVISAGTQIID